MEITTVSISLYTRCGPCRRIAPFVEELALKYRQVAKFIKVDVDQCQVVLTLCSNNLRAAYTLYYGLLLITTFSLLPTLTGNCRPLWRSGDAHLYVL